MKSAPAITIETVGNGDIDPSRPPNTWHGVRAREVRWRIKRATFRHLAKGLIRLCGYEIISLGRWRGARNGARPFHLQEEHHRWYGGPWCLGYDNLEALVEEGLLPHHHLLDFGCGSLRSGIRIIPYLDTDRYFGIDAHWPSLQVAAAYEIPLHRLEPKRPRLLYSAAMEIHHFGVKFDRVLAYSFFNHLTPEQCRRAFSALRENLAAGGRILAGMSIGLSDSEIADQGLRVLGRKARSPRFIDRQIEWFELGRDDESKPCS